MPILPILAAAAGRFSLQSLFLFLSPHMLHLLDCAYVPAILVTQERFLNRDNSFSNEFRESQRMAVDYRNGVNVCAGLPKGALTSYFTSWGQGEA